VRKSARFLERVLIEREVESRILQLELSVVLANLSWFKIEESAVKLDARV